MENENKPRILITEDDTENQRFLRMFLGKSFITDICDSDVTLYENLSKNHYDVILMDISLKGIKIIPHECGHRGLRENADIEVARVARSAIGKGENSAIIFLLTIKAVSLCPNGLSCIPACQMDTFSAFHV